MSSPLSTALPEPLRERIQALAANQGISPDQFITAALEEKLAWLEAEKRMWERSARGNLEGFQRVMDKVPDVEPEEHDRLSPELAARLDEKFGKVR